ncbi:MAG: hypothetical protein C0191_04570 [Mucilaginibacter sp.]|nr:MAG: hypothetical protein C0191_04570 [Mucilaginibacter sp.]HEK22042.1 DUF2141 domain-containing protein [Bacteroidota bacterium]
MKKTTVFSINLFVGLLLLFFGSYIQAQDLPIRITGIRSSNGKIVINVFRDHASYDKEEPYKKFSFDKKQTEKGAINVKINLDPGTYGITLLDDENGNGKIDKNLIRMPKEGFGFSNFYMEKLKKPCFDDFKIDLKTKPLVEIRLKYL